MERIPINPGSVEWSGENPGIYLKESADGPFENLVSFFRVICSPHGRGHAVFLFLDPHGQGKSPEKRNFCVTDNRPLAQYLKDNFLSHFAMFRGVPALSNFHIEKGSDFIASGDAKTTYTERFRSETGEVTLTWEPLSDSFMVEMPKDKSATGQHEMFSVFIPASGARVLINGRSMASGRPFPRDVAGKTSSTAFLAFSETWVRR